MVADSGTRAAAWVMAAGALLLVLGVALAVLLVSPANFSLGGLRADQRVLIAAGGLAGVGALLALAGLALYVFVPAFSGTERARRGYGSHRTVLASTLLAAVLGNVLAAAYFVPAALFSTPSPAGGSDLSRQMLSPAGIAVAAGSLDLALLAIVYLRVVRPGVIDWSTMGLTREHLASRLAIGGLVGLLLFGVSGVVEALLDYVGVHQTQSSIFESVTRASLGEYGLILAAGAVIAPIVEEIYFRGYVFRAYLEQKGTIRAFLFSAALFALVHTNLPASLPIFAMGLLLAFVYYRTGSIIPAIVAHAVNNAAAFTLLYLGLVQSQ